MSFVLELSIFFIVIHDCVTCDSDICDNHVTGVTITCDITSYPLSKFKNKEKRKTKIKINRKEK